MLSVETEDRGDDVVDGDMSISTNRLRVFRISLRLSGGPLLSSGTTCDVKLERLGMVSSKGQSIPFSKLQIEFSINACCISSAMDDIFESDSLVNDGLVTA
jgi:hypothetical protein